MFNTRKITKIYSTSKTTMHTLTRINLDYHTSKFLVMLSTSNNNKSTLLNLGYFAGVKHWWIVGSVGGKGRNGCVMGYDRAINRM
jgi:ABC-type antimicrobial peptide transport system, ATPase component